MRKFLRLKHLHKPTEENASTADENQAADEPASTRAEEILVTEETSRATTSVAPEQQVRTAKESKVVPEEIAQDRPTTSVVPEEIDPIPSAPPAPTPSPILPSALEVKKTKAAERAALKKSKTSISSESSAPKKARILTSSIENPIDVGPLSSMPSKELVPYGEHYEIPDESVEEDPSAASIEQMDEEIEVDTITSTPQLSSPMPQFTAEEAGVQEMEEDEDVDIGSTILVMNDDFWDSQHPNSPLFTPLQQIPQSSDGL